MNAARVTCARATRAGRTIGIIFWQLTRAARRIGKREGPHYAAVQAARSFYVDWLAPKIAAHFREARGHA